MGSCREGADEKMSASKEKINEIIRQIEKNGQESGLDG